MRKYLFKVHYWLALSAAIPLLLIIFSGMLLVFKQPLDELLMPQTAALPYAGLADMPPRKNLNELAALLTSELPEYEIGSWELFSDGEEADRVYVIRHGTADWYKVYLDPYAGVLLSEPQTLTHYLTDWLLTLHYTLLLDDVFSSAPQLGLISAFLCAIMLCVIGVTGLIIYRRFWRHFFTFNRQGKPMVVTRRLHRLFGIWSAPVLLLAGLTGVYFNLVEYLEETEEQQQEEYRVTQRLYAETLDLQQLLQNSREEIRGFTPTYLLFPYQPHMGITLYGAVPGNNPFASEYASSLTYDAFSADIISRYDSREQSFWYQLADSLRSIHFGDFAGNSSRVVWALSAAGLLFLLGSGVLMFSHRQWKKQRRR